MTHDWFPVIIFKLIVTGATCAAEMITLSRTSDFTPFGELKILPINYIYIIEFVSLGLGLLIHDSGLFAWISQTTLSRTYFIIAAIQDGPSLHIEEPQPTPYQNSQFYSLLYIY